MKTVKLTGEEGAGRGLIKKGLGKNRLKYFFPWIKVDKRCNFILIKLMRLVMALVGSFVIKVVGCLISYNDIFHALFGDDFSLL